MASTTDSIRRARMLLELYGWERVFDVAFETEPEALEMKAAFEELDCEAKIDRIKCKVTVFCPEKTD